MAVMELWRRRDLEGAVKTEYIDGNFFTQDSVGNLVGVRVYSNGAEAALTGSVTGYCVLPSGETVSVAGTRSGNQASILVPQSALAYTGPLGIVLKLIDGNTITTLMSIIVVVYRSKTDTVIIPSSQIITDWANQISAAMQAVADASAAQDAKIADLRSALNSADITSKFTFVGGRRTNAVTGVRQTEADAEASGFVDISGYNYLVLTMRYRKGSAGASGIAFYSSAAESGFISGVAEPESVNIAADSYTIIRIPIPVNATHVRTTWWRNTTDEFAGIDFGCIAEKVPGYIDDYTFKVSKEHSDKLSGRMLGTDITELFNAWNAEKRVNVVTGNLQTMETAKASTLIDISGYDSVLMVRRFVHTAGGATGLAFYNASEAFISGEQDPYDTTMSADTYRIVRTEIPEGAKYVRTTWWNDNQAQAAEIEFFCIGEHANWRSVSVDEFRDEIARLEAEIYDPQGGTLPDYYSENGYIDNRVAAIKAIMETQSDKSVSAGAATDVLHGGDQFFWFTDPHFYWYSTPSVYNGLNSGALIKYIKERTNIRKVFCGGDLVGGSGMTKAVCTKNLQLVKMHLSGIWDDLYMIIGNHEWNNPNAQAGNNDKMLTVSQIYDTLLKDKERDFGSVSSMGDYWIDNVPQKIRYFCIGTTYDATIADAQIAWLGAELLTVPNGYTVVILSHTGVNTVGGFHATFQHIADMLDAAKAKGSYSYGGTTYNFGSFGGTVACIINGHIHMDASRKTTGGIWVIATTCDQGPTNSTSEGFNTARAIGTINEQAVDVFLIDTTAKNIKTIRIGGSWDGSAALSNPDRIFSYA